MCNKAPVKSFALYVIMYPAKARQHAAERRLWKEDTFLEHDVLLESLKALCSYRRSTLKPLSLS